MKKISSKLIAVIFCCVFFAVALLGIISISESHKLAMRDAENAVMWMARDYADKFSGELAVIDDKLTELEVFIQNTIDYDALKSDRDYLAGYEAILADYIKDFADKRTDSVAGWVYFDPKWSDSPHDVYYVDQNGDGKAERQDYIPFAYYNNTPTNSDDKQWWYGPIETGKTFWTNPYQWQLVNDEFIVAVSCVKPVYINNTFICVVGTYYRFDEMQEAIRDIKVFDTGYAALLNEKLDIIIHPTLNSGNRFTSDNLATVQDGRYADIAEQVSENQEGLLYCKNSDENSIIAYSKLSNGWVMAIIPPHQEMFSGAYALTVKLAIALAICIIVSLAVAVFVVRRITRPILQIAKTVRIIGTGNLDVQVCVKTNDEMKLLADSINSMTGNIKSLQDELVRQAYYDELTGVRNFTKFKIDAKQLLEENPECDYTIIKLDIHRFKLINDIYGFAVGDEIIREFAYALNDAFDPNVDAFGRINADNFAALVCGDKATSNAKREHFLGMFEQCVAKIIPDKLIIHRGWYCAEKGDQDLQGMFEKANFAHQLAKQSGQPSCAFDHDSRMLARRNQDIEKHMEAALKNEEFLVYLQPKYKLDGETLASAEALVRWPMNGKELLSPACFIPVFEQNGFITKLDMFMFRRACQILRSWIDCGVTPMPISVNFSRLHINNTDFVKELSDLADAYKIPHELLEVEITETVISDNIDRFQSVLDNLHESNFTLSMDDFGTGYSSLGLLKSIPVDVLKMDKTFFDNSINSERAKTVIASVIQMAKSLGICTVAEGVETLENVQWLRELGCDIVQGYYYGRPMPVCEFTKLVKELK